MQGGVPAGTQGNEMLPGQRDRLANNFAEKRKFWFFISAFGVPVEEALRQPGGN